ncbi:MAG: DUF5926 family protein [Micrococcales bacterium]|nr:DUF5926 family protein [Micrococcales bacterium]
MASERIDYVSRPFEGLTGEADLIAMREVVPAATATAATTKEHGGHDVIVTTLLPNIRTAWRRPDGGIVIALQTTYHSGDASRDIAQALELAMAAEPGTEIPGIDISLPGRRLQDLLDPAIPLEVTVQTSFDFWKELDPDNEEKEWLETIERASEAINPTAAVPELSGAYWTLLNKRPFLRWSLGIEEEKLLDALARLHARRESAVIPEARYAGAFRALGLVIPVWELPDGTEADEISEPGAEFLARLKEALADTSELGVLDRRARAGLVARSVTLR